MIFTQIILIIVSVALSVLFFKIYENKSQNLQVIDSVVVSQWGDTNHKTTTDSDGVTSTTTSRHVEVTIEYEFNGEKKQAIVVSSMTDKIHVNSLKIFINENGEIVSDYGRIVIWKIEAIVLLCFAVLMTLILIFRLGSEFMAGTIFAGIAFVIVFLVGCQIIENFIYNDLVCFLCLFVNVGIYMLICGLLTALFGQKVKHVKEYANLEKEINDLETQNNEDDSASEESKIEYQYCVYCSSRVQSTDKYCPNCGSNIDK